jgi:hypothetical protein
MAKPRSSRPTLVGNMAPIPQNLQTRFIVQSATPNPGLMDATQTSDLDYILRPILTNSLSESASTSNCSAWHYCLLVLPSSLDNAHATIPRSYKEQDLCRRTSEIDAIPATTVLLDTPPLLRCSLRPISNTPELDTPHPTTCTTFKDYVKTLPTWEQDLFLNVTEKPSTVPLYELLNQKRTTLLAVSDGGAADAPKSYGSFGWVLGKRHEILWECKGIARGYPMRSYRAEGYGRISLLSFLTHCILYLDIQPSEDLCITSYCDNHSLLKNEEKFHTRDIDSYEP